MSLLLDRLEKSHNLPLGHVERKKTEKAVIKEYKNSFEQEKAFIKRLPKRFRFLNHELAHHINRMDRIVGSHGNKFLWTEQFLFDLFMNEILPIWKLKEQGL
ncbi:MAG: hypothetical protein ACFFDH_12770 [Promethearchaeota archaeon]